MILLQQDYDKLQFNMKILMKKAEQTSNIIKLR